MLNDHISHEEAKEISKQRIKEAEDYNLQKQLGYGDSRAARWVFVLIVILIAVVIGLLL